MAPSMIVFVHGLGGDPRATWGQFPDLIKADDGLRNYGTIAFSYPTSLFRLPFSSKAPKVQTLADALRTFIELRCASAEDVVLVCHSLGGVIARQYLVDEVKRKTLRRVRGLLLYACPTSGAGLAEVASYISWRHNQLRQLCRDSDLIRSIEKDWETLNLSQQLAVRYVVAAQDRVVAEMAARSSWGTPNVEVIADRGHIDVVKPRGPDDLPYLILQTFVKSLGAKTQRDATSSRIGITADPPSSNDSASQADRPMVRQARAGRERFDLTRFQPTSVLRETDHSLIQKGTYKGATIVLKRTQERLCDLEALRGVVEAISTGLPSGPDPDLLLAPRSVWADDGRVWEVQDYVDGIPLGTIVSRNRQPIFGRFLDDCADDLFRILEALEHIGVVHRDIWPDNLLLTPTRGLSLIDWTFCTRPSAPNQVPVQTAGFTAPEQQRGHAVHASDWFSVGATLYFLANRATPEPQKPAALAKGLERLDYTSSRLEYKLGGEWRNGLAALVSEVLALDVGTRRIPSRPYWKRISKPIWPDEMLDSLRVLELDGDAHLVMSNDSFWVLPKDLESLSDYASTMALEKRAPGLRSSLVARANELSALLRHYGARTSET